MNYNPFFPGGAISMARVLFDGLVEYDDGRYLCISVFRVFIISRRNSGDNLSNGQGRCDFLALGSRART